LGGRRGRAEDQAFHRPFLLWWVGCLAAVLTQPRRDVAPHGVREWQSAKAAGHKKKDKEKMLIPGWGLGIIPGGPVILGIRSEGLIKHSTDSRPLLGVNSITLITQPKKLAQAHSVKAS